MTERSAHTLPPIEVVDEVGSTNAEMKTRARAGAVHGSALQALAQTSGRGQRAHTWTSPKGGLYLSILIRPEVPKEALPALPVACALGALGALREVGCVRASLKWPNDIVVGDRKVAGILTELVSSPAGVFAVCGIGVNMMTPAVMADERNCAALHPTGLIDELAPSAQAPSLPKLAEVVRAGVLDAVQGWTDAYGQGGVYVETGRPGSRVPGADPQRWIFDPVRAGAEGPLAPLLTPYNACLAFVGARVRVIAIDGAEKARGTFLGVDGYGHALVALDNGSVGTYEAADASIRPVAQLAR
ncbi:MAG: biotin--[acetyl-CoA-carboxylase] ligase [Coriobacteriaceae bacterium]|nr:biotin--[acetyl-CoA-carboxylase] ligase [Coriobacteriaceae bacterium]